MKVEITEKELIKNIKLYNKMYKKCPPEWLEALKEGEIYKEANLTPMYAYDQITNTVIVTSKENFEKKGH